MIISETIAALEALKEKHGDVDVTVFQYSGGEDDLHLVTPEFNGESNSVVFEVTDLHESGVYR